MLIYSYAKVDDSACNKKNPISKQAAEFEYANIAKGPKLSKPAKPLFLPKLNVPNCSRYHYTPSYRDPSLSLHIVKSINASQT